MIKSLFIIIFCFLSLFVSAQDQQTMDKIDSLLDIQKKAIYSFYENNDPFAYDIINWINYQIDMHKEGEYADVILYSYFSYMENKMVTLEVKKGDYGYLHTNSNDSNIIRKWISKPITFEGYMNWKTQKLLNN